MTEEYHRPILDLRDEKTFRAVESRLIQGEDPQAIADRLDLLRRARNAVVPVDGYTLGFLNEDGEPVKFAAYPCVTYAGLFAVGEVVRVTMLPPWEDDMTFEERENYIGD